MGHPSDNKELHILLVEDSPADARLVVEGLTEKGSSVRLHVVQNGDDALSFLRRQGQYVDAPAPDLVLLDLNLPGRDGREVLRDIKSDLRLLRTPVIILSSSQSPSDIDACYDSFANCYLAKPVHLDDYLTLFKLVRQFWLQVAQLPNSYGGEGARFGAH